MPWPFKRAERRNYSAIILQALENAASAKAADEGATAALEACSGLAARMIGAGEVSGPDWAKVAISPEWRMQAVREIYRNGEHLSLVSMARDGRALLTPCSDWDWHGDSVNEEAWEVRATAYGPHATITRQVRREEVIALRWAQLAVDRARGRGPLALASLTAKAAAESEKALADELAGPIANLLPLPEGHGGQDSELTSLWSDIKGARGKAVPVESMAGGWGDRSSAPQADWKPARLGANPPPGVVQAAKDAFARMCAACGGSPALFDDSDGTAKREAARQYFLGAVQPLAGLMAGELSRRLEAEIGISLEPYFADMQGRTTAFQKLVAGGMEVERAAMLSGVLAVADD